MTLCLDAMTHFLDAHTHTCRRNAVVNLDPVSAPEARLEAPYVYSVGIHPWNASRVTPEALDRLRELALSPRVVAIGETGIDLIHEGVAVADLDCQLELLRRHVALSEETAKPLLLHVVRRFAEIIALRRTLNPTQPWIIHGFRGKPELARQLLNQGFFLSFGAKANPSSVAVTPPSRLLVETDESPLTVDEIASALGVDVCAQNVAFQTGQFGALDGAPLEES